MSPSSKRRTMAPQAKDGGSTPPGDTVIKIKKVGGIMSFRDMLPIYHRIGVKATDTNEVSAESIKRISIYLMARYKMEFPAIIGTAWIDKKTKYSGDDGKDHTLQGTLPKRLSSWMYNRHSIRLTEYDLQRIGEIACENMETADSFEFEFVDKVDWEAGSFGDRHACFITNEKYRNFLHMYGALFMRFYEPGTDKGVARSILIIPNGDWLVYNKQKLSPDADGQLLLQCNAYYCRYGLGLEKQAKILSQFLGIQPTPVQVFSDDNVFYSNLRASGGDFLYSTMKNTNPSAVHLLWDGRPQIVCKECQNKKKCSREIPDVCDDCLQIHYLQCGKCFKYRKLEEIVTYEEVSLCKTCYAALPRCAACDKKIVRQYTTVSVWEDGARHLAIVCYNEHKVKHCMVCSEWVLLDKPCRHIADSIIVVHGNKFTIDRYVSRDAHDNYVARTRESRWAIAPTKQNSKFIPIDIKSREYDDRQQRYTSEQIFLRIGDIERDNTNRFARFAFELPTINTKEGDEV